MTQKVIQPCAKRPINILILQSFLLRELVLHIAFRISTHRSFFFIYTDSRIYNLIHARYINSKSLSYRYLQSTKKTDVDKSHIRRVLQQANDFLRKFPMMQLQCTIACCARGPLRNYTFLQEIPEDPEADANNVTPTLIPEGPRSVNLTDSILCILSSSSLSNCTSIEYRAQRSPSCPE